MEVKATGFLLCAILYLVIFMVHAQKQCNQPNPPINYKKVAGNWNVGYQISNQSHILTPCFKFQMKPHGFLIRAVVLYKQASMISRKATLVPFEDGTITFGFDENPTFVGYINVKPEEDGILVISMCPPDLHDEVVLVAYKRFIAGLAEKADEVAKRLSRKANLFKVNQEDC